MKLLKELFKTPEVLELASELIELTAELVEGAYMEKGHSLPSTYSGVVPYGRIKNGGGHDHRYNKGEDRTPAQKEADKNRRT
ncbi:MULTISPECIES: hypothetical protein [unclassified Pseudomonas]|uniref:hypothetical protein n=1 Tax=unclassified Pseudomonas TaxID=196821 RepID=UPI000A0DCC13|nr:MULTISPECIES: hypothetical protein [unclassified Pseudomonas]SMF36996.1 hypothetical protein SAMN02745962_03331 [Pseudomonas sp. LAIL14HWK12:I11]SMR78964.1 hypothetical protein SAMN05661028_03770 [Pseudomonas sp. LAIL14HWK12:I10]SOD04722.1 hypothetical protein SAMN05660296_03319 [Pseudomonas sp. LAIL14HWK12:I8]